MYELPYFKEKDFNQIIEFICNYPFATLMAINEQNKIEATQIPLLLKENNNGYYLEGHIMKNTTHANALATGNEVLLLFTGPHCYVSANWYSNPLQASTWNYMSVQIKGKFIPLDENNLKRILQEITDKYENNPDSNATFNLLDPNYISHLSKALIGFKIEILEINHTFKLSQNRDEISYKNIITHLSIANNPDENKIAFEMKKRYFDLFKKNKINIAVDGFSSSGKSSLAKKIAQLLHYIFIDTGAMYRAITYYFIKNNINYNNENLVKEGLQGIQLEFKNNESNMYGLYLNNILMDENIRTSEINNKVSDVASNFLVRKFLVNQQQQIGLNKGVVMDGRDIGTVVFPDAALKLFITADIDIRSQRRFIQMQKTDSKIDLMDVKKNLMERDRIDTTRQHSPLKKAADALVIDNSNLSLDDEIKIIIDYMYNNTI